MSVSAIVILICAYEVLSLFGIMIGECKWSTGENGRLLTRRLEKIARSLSFTKGKEVSYFVL